MTPESGKDFKNSIRQALDMSTDENEKELLDKFATMRTEALRHVPEKTTGKLRSSSMSVLGLTATAAVVVVALVALLPEKKVPTDIIAGFDDLDILTSSEDFEMFEQEDVEFYMWLESELENQS